jgi:hypothetical protein
MRPNVSHSYAPSFNKYYDTYATDGSGTMIKEYTRFEGNSFGVPGNNYSNTLGLSISNTFEAKVREFEKRYIDFYNTKVELGLSPENMKPIFITKNVINNGNSRILKDAHIKFELKQNETYMSGIGFNMANKFDLLLNQQPIDLVYTIDENEWNGKKSIQINVIDFKLSA